MKKNFLLNTAYQFLCICLPFIVTPYISRIFGADGIGEFSYNMTIVSYFGLFITLGLNNYGNREIASVKDDLSLLSKTFANIYVMQLTVGVAVFLIYIGYSCLFANNQLLSFVLGLYLFSYLFDINWFFFGLEQFKLTVTRNTIIKIISTILVLVCIKEKSDLHLYALITSISYFATQIFIWPFLKGKIVFVKPTWVEVKKHIKPNLILFIPVLGVSLYNMMDKIMLGGLSTNAELGFYESADKIKAIPIIFITALGTVALPRISYLNIKQKQSEMVKLFSNSITLINFVISAICFGMIAVASDFVPIFFGKGYEKTTDILYILLLSCFFIGIENVIKTQLLIPKKKDKIYIQSIFLGAGFNLVINAILIPTKGGMGAACATLITEALVCSYQIIRVSSDINILHYILRDWFLYVTGIIMLIFVFIFPDICDSGIQNLLLKIILGVLVYSIIILCLKFSEIKCVIKSIMLQLIHRLI